MTTWRHTNEWHSDFTGRTYCMAPRGNGSPCECDTPTPDPESPCEECPPDNPDRPWVYHRCARCREFTEFCTCTRCACGHPIEEATR